MAIVDVKSDWPRRVNDSFREHIIEHINISDIAQMSIEVAVAIDNPAAICGLRCEFPDATRTSARNALLDSPKVELWEDRASGLYVNYAPFCCASSKLVALIVGNTDTSVICDAVAWYRPYSDVEPVIQLRSRVDLKCGSEQNPASVFSLHYVYSISFNADVLTYRIDGVLAE